MKAHNDKIDIKKDGITCLGNIQNCKGKLSGVLTHDEILHFNLISENFFDKCLKGTSYDLRLGEGHYLYRTENDCWELVWIGGGETPDEFKQQDYITIEPFGSALIQLKETIDTKTCIDKHGIFIVGKFDLKLKMFIRGLISQQATQVEPNCIGKLFCYIFNQTSETIKLYYETKIATLEFYYVSCLTQCVSEQSIKLKGMFDNEHKNGKYQNLNENKDIKRFCSAHGINDVRFFKHEPQIELPAKGGLTYFYKEFNNRSTLIDLAHKKIIEDFNNHKYLNKSSIENLEKLTDARLDNLETQIKIFNENAENFKKQVLDHFKKDEDEGKHREQKKFNKVSLIIAIVSILIAILSFIYPIFNSSSNHIQSKNVENKKQSPVDSVKRNGL